jgi:ribosome-binding factor A
MNERRLARLQEQIKQRLAEVLQRDIADPKLGLVTITRIELDSEFTLCRAWWSVLAPTAKGEAKAKIDSEGVLQRARGFCQREVGKTLNTRSVPHLEFVFDEGIAGAIRVNQLLQDLRTKEQRPGEPPNPPPNPEAPGPAPLA